MTAETDGITFEVERIALVKERLEVSGRWYGIRGRRFMRPTLILRARPDDGEHRVLADLEHKPWAAEDGDEWIAAFPVSAEPESAMQIELAVAPDITVQLASGDGAAKPGRRTKATVAAAAEARSPRVRADPVRGRPRERSPEAERLRERLTAAEENTERERARRATVDQALEEERRAARQLRAELGRVRAELELAGAVQRELDTASAALDSLRSEFRDASRRLETAERELGEERISAERLRRQLADAGAAVTRLTRSGQAQASAEADLAPRERRAGERAPGNATPRERPPAPVGAELSRPERGAVERPRPERAGGERPRTDRATAIHHPVAPRTERPLNPSLRSGSWLVRGLAVIVMLIVIVAVVLVIRSTVG